MSTDDLTISRRIQSAVPLTIGLARICEGLVSRMGCPNPLLFEMVAGKGTRIGSPEKALF